MRSAFSSCPHPFLSSGTGLRIPECVPRSRRLIWQCSANPSTSRPVTIIGAGVAGLAAAHHVATAGIPVRILEAADEVGGRIRSDVVDGFILDRGFQVFIEAYPEQGRLLGKSGYEALNLKPFAAGALVRTNGAFYKIADPFRTPIESVKGVVAPIGTLADKLRVAALRITVMSKTPDAILSGAVRGTAAQSTLKFLSTTFSSDMIDKFFRPFYQGIFLSPLEDQAATMLAYVFRMFAAAPASLPAEGIGAFPTHLAAALPKSSVSIELGCEVRDLSEVVDSSSAVIVATDGPAAARLLASPEVPEPQSLGSICLYFSSPNPAPIADPILVLNGATGKDGIVNNMFFPTSVSSSFAPSGQTLVSTTVVGDELLRSDADLEKDVRAHMTAWFGAEEVAAWKFLRAYRVPHSQPAQDPTGSYDKPPSAQVSGGPIFVCGDHRNTPTVNGALESGRLAAEEVLQHLAQPKDE